MDADTARAGDLPAAGSDGTARPGGDELTRRLVESCAALVRGRRVVIVAGVLAGATREVRQLAGWGAGPFLVVASTRGTGELLGPDEAQVCLATAGSPLSMTEAVRAEAAFPADPPAAVRDAVAAFDPDRTALVLLSPLATADRFLGRQTLRGRPPAYEAMEDKSLADALWDAAGVTRAPAVVVDADLAIDAARRLDQGSGTVWSADASHGLNGGAEYVRWVRAGERAETDQAEGRQAEAAYADLAAVSRRIRVMPFLEGVPCSIHGFAIGTGVAVFRPVELVVLRRPDSTRLLYCGISTCWDPAPGDREQMRDVARRVGRYLQGANGYQGGFSVDGVMTVDGFRPTEMNPRFSGGLSTIGKGVPDLPLALLQAATVRGIDLGTSAADLESVLLPAADAARFGSVYTVSDRVRPELTTVFDVAGGSNGMQVARAGQPPAATLELGPAAGGGLVRYTPLQMTPGRLMAPEAVAALSLANRLWDTGFQSWQAAPEVRSG